MLVEKELSELFVGHYVIKIVKQEGSYSLTAAGHIKNQAVIDHLKSKKVYRVLIDDSKTIISKNTNNEPAEKIQSTINSANLKQASEIFNQSKKIQKKLFDDALSGSSLELSPVVEVTNKSIDAIFTSPDSLACMLNIREKDEYLFCLLYTSPSPRD